MSGAVEMLGQLSVLEVCAIGYGVWAFGLVVLSWGTGIARRTARSVAIAGALGTGGVLIVAMAVESVDVLKKFEAPVTVVAAGILVMLAAKVYWTACGDEAMAGKEVEKSVDGE